MARRVLDSVVLETNEERQVLSITPEEMFIYAGTVAHKFPKISILKMKPAPPPMELTQPIDKYYRSIKLTDSPAFLTVGENSVETVPEVIRILKSLLLGQVSRCQDYSVAVTYVTQSFFSMCIQCNAVLPIPRNPNFTVFQNVVVDEVSEYIKQKLDAANIGYETYKEAEQIIDSSAPREVYSEYVESEPVDWSEDYGEDDLEF